mmetsp:Transcript_14103/g.28287  ORF Transcript_14103/g.28287 Transcript_14103/m.28287 type:complete len:98 (+) Transcript_14103:1936-2229(+)
MRPQTDKQSHRQTRQTDSVCVEKVEKREETKWPLLVGVEALKNFPSKVVMSVDVILMRRDKFETRQHLLKQDRGSSKNTPPSASTTRHSLSLSPSLA